MFNGLFAKPVLLLELLHSRYLFIPSLEGLICGNLVRVLDVSVLAFLIPERQSALIEIREHWTTPRRYYFLFGIYTREHLSQFVTHDHGRDIPRQIRYNDGVQCDILIVEGLLVRMLAIAPVD